MNAKLRSFNAADYAALTDVHNAVHPDYRIADGEFERYDGLREEKIRWGRFVAELGGEVVAWASYTNSSWLYHPRKFWLDVLVHPDAFGITGRQKGRPGWSTDWRGNHEACELPPLLGQPVDIRRSNRL